MTPRAAGLLPRPLPAPGARNPCIKGEPESFSRGLGLAALTPPPRRAAMDDDDLPPELTSAARWSDVGTGAPGGEAVAGFGAARTAGSVVVTKTYGYGGGEAKASYGDVEDDGAGPTYGKTYEYAAVPEKPDEKPETMAGKCGERTKACASSCFMDPEGLKSLYFGGFYWHREPILLVVTLCFLMCVGGDFLLCVTLPHILRQAQKTAKGLSVFADVSADFLDLKIAYADEYDRIFSVKNDVRCAMKSVQREVGDLVGNCTHGTVAHSSKRET